MYRITLKRPMASCWAARKAMRVEGKHFPPIGSLVQFPLGERYSSVSGFSIKICIRELGLMSAVLPKKDGYDQASQNQTDSCGPKQNQQFSTLLPRRIMRENCLFQQCEERIFRLDTCTMDS